MDGNILQMRHYGLNICASEALWMELCEIVDITGYLACRIAGRGILDEKILGEALSRVEDRHLALSPLFLWYLPTSSYVSSGTYP
jgi:hypothetical protein